MSPGSQVTADLHKVLLYRKGDFFQAHKDTQAKRTSEEHADIYCLLLLIHLLTQRSDDHFASLLVFMPTSYRRGDFLLEQTEGFNSSGFKAQTQRALAAKRCRWVAFFADIPHSVAPITSGYRLVLAYNLQRRRVTEMAPQAGAFLAPSLQDMIDSLHYHFKHLLTQLSYWERERKDNSYVIHLQHDYTPSSMSLEHLGESTATSIKCCPNTFKSISRCSWHLNIRRRSLSDVAVRAGR